MQTASPNTQSRDLFLPVQFSHDQASGSFQGSQETQCSLTNWKVCSPHYLRDFAWQGNIFKGCCFCGSMQRDTPRRVAMTRWTSGIQQCLVIVFDLPEQHLQKQHVYFKAWCPIWKKRETTTMRDAHFQMVFLQGCERGPNNLSTLWLLSTCPLGQQLEAWLAGLVSIQQKPAFITFSDVPPFPLGQTLVWIIYQLSQNPDETGGVAVLRRRGPL